MPKTLINVLSFYIGWFACVVGAARGYPMLGPLVVVLLLGLHLLLTVDTAREVRLLAIAGVVGSLLDTLMMWSGMYTFVGHPKSWLCPLWITALWINFATTLRSSLSWLLDRYWLAALFGAVGGPLSYYAGARLGALTFPADTQLSLVVLTLVWGLALPGLVWLAALVPASRRRFRELAGIVFLPLSLSLSSSLSQAAEIEGVIFPDRYDIHGTPLILNGVGLLRYRIVFKGYVAALYLGEGVQPSHVLTDVPKRLELAYFWAIAGPDFGKAADALLKDNVSTATLTRLQPRIDRLHALYEDVKPGDRYSLTYIPGLGTELALNGRVKGTIEGADFAAAYFAIWLGPKPLSASLKAQLLAPSATTIRVAQNINENNTPSAFPEGSSSVIESLTWRLAGRDPAVLRQQVKMLVGKIEGAAMVKDDESQLVVSLPTSELATFRQGLATLGQLSGAEDIESGAPTTLLRVQFAHP